MQSAEAEDALVIDAPTETLLGQTEVRILKGLEGLEGVTVTVDGERYVSDAEGLVGCVLEREGTYSSRVKRGGESD